MNIGIRKTIEPKNFIVKDEMTKERTSQELVDWVEQKLLDISEQESGKKALRMREGFCKQFIEEIYPLSILARLEFPSRNDVTFKPIIGSQNYDALIIYNLPSPKIENKIEITQAHEGYDNYLRREMIQKYGSAPLSGQINRNGRKMTDIELESLAKKVSVRSIQDSVDDQMKLIGEALDRKLNKSYERDTSLLIIFDDLIASLEEETKEQLRDFINAQSRIKGKFSTLYLVGHHQRIYLKFEY